MRESFVVHSEYIEDLPEENKKEYLWYCYNYGINNIEPVLNGFELTVWTKIKRRIDTDKLAYDEATLKKKISLAKCHYQQNRASAQEIELLKNSNWCNLVLPKENGESPTYTDTNTRGVYVSDNVSVSVYDNVYDTVYVSDAKVCENQKYFISLWQKNADVFGVTATIENPKDFAAFFNNDKITKEYIYDGVDNYCKAIRSGQLERRFIPSTPDRFILKNTLERFQQAYSTDKKSTIYDADHRGEFAEIVRA